jgi:glutamyl-tRNA reductase
MQTEQTTGADATPSASADHGTGLDLGTGLHLFGVSISHARGDGGLSFTKDQASGLLRRFAELDPGSGAIALSTCNRTEFYLDGDGGPTVERFHRALELERPGADCADAGPGRYRLEGSCVARHLFRVGAGLESSILGDVQILGQLRAALSTAAESGTLTPRLRSLGDRSLRLGRVVRTETSISDGGAGVGSAVAALIATRSAHEGSAPSVLLVGAGDAAAAVAGSLDRRTVGRLTIVNRSTRSTARLAAAVGASAREWSALRATALAADVIVVAVAAPAPVLGEALAREIVRRGHTPLVVDISVPAGVQRVPGLEVVDLAGIAETTPAVRAAAVPQVEDRIDNAVRDWLVQERLRPVDALVGSLYRSLDTTLERLTAELVASPPWSTLPPQQAAAAVESTRRMARAEFRRALHQHVTGLRQLAGSDPPFAATRQGGTHAGPRR